MPDFNRFIVDCVVGWFTLHEKIWIAIIFLILGIVISFDYHTLMYRDALQSMVDSCNKPVWLP